ncbi:unnamed protein product [Cylindrotheca closterium]|uniref:Uncharacterized protein n=1 Tax=Cylindrotheca closterium TaxID=2856 RepID=A0AAD2GCH2_9STRA|nr:unnamed protein product [Cylindrotheca closterium]
MSTTKTPSKADKTKEAIEKVSKYAEVAGEKLQEYAKPAFDFLVPKIPVAIEYSKKAIAFYNGLPQNELNLLIGAVYCFFGGLYPVLFAAAMAAEYGGRQTIYEAIKDLAEEATIIIEQSKKDDDVDQDKDGIKDVNQIEAKEFVQRKTLLVLQKMNPEKVDTAMASIYKVWLSVAAVLSIRFARTISFSLAIADFLNRPVDRYISPTVQIAIPDEYDRWVPVILGWISKSIAMSIAWWLETLRSAFASALKGGLMISRSIYDELLERKIDLGGLVTEKHTDTRFDEYMSYGFAAWGFYFQWRMGFGMPFPFNLILWPFEFAEWFIRWSITSA